MADAGEVIRSIDLPIFANSPNADVDMSVWTGRNDANEGPLALRWHQRVQPWTKPAAPGIALIGFACDEGVRRNQGRVGAAGGPLAIRKALANLAWHSQLPVYDVGDVTCSNGDLELAQTTLAARVAALFQESHFPLVLGGGHETAWGTFQGLTHARPYANFGVINLDAHFDVRPPTPPSSGTAFSQIADWSSRKNRKFRCLALGISQTANTQAAFERARQFGIEWRLDSDLVPWNLPAIRDTLDRLLGDVDHLYLSLDLDILPASIMPAVSAPSARGVSIEIVEWLLQVVVDSGKLVVADVVELNPLYDREGHAAKVAARLASILTAAKVATSVRATSTTQAH